MKSDIFADEIFWKELIKLVSTLIENNGLEKGDIACSSTDVSTYGEPYKCENALYWNTTKMFASPGSDTRTFTLYFPKLYASVSKI